MHNADDTSGSLQWPDYVVVGVLLLISSAIGIYYRFSGGRQKTVEEYFTAKGSMNVPMLAIALMVAFMSAIAILGVSGEIYIYGVQFNLTLIGFGVGSQIAAFCYVPVFFNLQNISVYQYLERRFGVTARLVASVANFVQLILYTGVVLYAPALALEATIGLSSVITVLVIGTICTFYSSIGGMKAVLATDIFQGLLMFAAIFAIIAVACQDFDGGIAEAWSIAEKGGRLDIWNFDPDPTERHTFWTLVIGSMFFFLGNFAVSQITMQRLLAAKSLWSAQMALILNAFLIVGMTMITSLAGVVLYAWFEGCDPVSLGQISSYDQITPYFAKIRMSRIPGLSGVFIAGVFSASLSTVSALLNSLAAVAVADYIQPLCRKCGQELSDSTASLVGKIIAVVNGLFVLVVAYVASQLGNILQVALAINGAMGGPVLGLFSLGIFVEDANEIGSVIGTVISLIFSMWIIFGQPKRPAKQLPVSFEKCSNATLVNSTMYEARLLASNAAEDIEYFELYQISYLLYTLLGMIVTLVFGYGASMILRYFGKNPIIERDPALFTPLLAARMRRRRADAVQTTSSQVFVLNSK